MSVVAWPTRLLNVKLRANSALRQSSQFSQGLPGSSRRIRQSSFICLQCRFHGSWHDTGADRAEKAASREPCIAPQTPRRLLHSARSPRRPEPPNDRSTRFGLGEDGNAEQPSKKRTDLETEATKFQREWQPRLDPQPQPIAVDTENPFPPSSPKGPKSDPSQSPTLPGDQSTFAVRIHHLSNQVIDSLTRIAHQLNIHTGTDYTPIQTIRDSIKTQERSLRSRHDDVAAAKTTHSASLKSQRTQQKEVVQLLERKHSWADADMERYMGLIRSEHVNERAVESAARDVAQAERALEEARQELERSERKMYHEEQVWSDTIRRNSTWITFGLMSLNVLLLLTQIVVVEPWRRRRLIREMRGALDEKSVVAPAAVTMALPEAVGATIPATEAAVEKAHVEAEVDAATPPVSGAVIADETPAEEIHTGATPPPIAIPAVAQDEELDELPSTALPATAFAHLPPHPFISADALLDMASWQGLLERIRIIVRDLFSERVVTLRRVDLTAKRFESAALGVMLGGLGILVGVVTWEE